MKRMMQWMLAAILILSSATVLTSCSSEDYPVAPPEEYTGVPLIIYDTDVTATRDNACGM